MMNSVSTATFLSISRNAVTDIQKQIADAGTEVTSGVLADPVKSLAGNYGLDQKLQAESASLTSYQSANNIASSNLTATQNALSSIYTDAQTFLKALISAQSTGTVTTLATQAQSLLSSFTSTLNTTVGGSYIFGGINNTVKPMSDYSTSAEAATATAFQTAFGMSQSSSSVSTISSSSMQSFLTGSFASLFSGANWSTNWSQASSTAMSSLISPNQTVPVTTSASANNTAFQTLAQAYVSIADLGINNLGSTTTQTVLSNAVSLMSSAMQGITNIETTLGLSQTQITNANSLMTTRATYLNNSVSTLQGVDAYQAASTLSNLSTQLEVAYSLSNRISKLSLVNYLTS